MQQSDLFAYTPPQYPFAPGHRGIETSREGANAIQPKVSGLHAKIMTILHKNGLEGATNCELRKAIGNIENGTMSARLRELVLQGRIMDSGFTRKAQSGVSQIVWVAEVINRVNVQE